MNIKKQTILVLTNSKDGEHSSVVIDKLIKANEKVFRFDTDKLQSGNTKIRFTTEANSFNFELRNDSGQVNSNEIKSVWYRRPNKYTLDITDVVQRKFAKEETLNALEGMWLSLTNAFWLSNLSSIEKARRKILQLSLAQEIGFHTPRTIVSNDPEEIRHFFETCNRRMIFKTIKQSFLDYGDHGFNIPTTLVTPALMENIGLVQQSPCLFQECINKKYELRVTIVGNKLFPVCIESQARQETSVDWRNPQFINELSYSLVKLPDNIQEMCLKMMHVLGLSFGAFDFAVDDRGEFIFFEINPNGQWYWIEKQTNACISDAIVGILAKG